LRDTGVPAIYVTHDQDEASAIADRVLLLHEGLIVQDGSPGQVYNSPANGWAARFLGLGNVLEGTFVAGEQPGLRTQAGVFALHCAHAHRDGDQLEGLLRPFVQGAGADHARDTVSGTVTDVVFRQDYFRVTLDNGMFFHLERAPLLGEHIVLKVRPVECLGRVP